MTMASLLRPNIGSYHIYARAHGRHGSHSMQFVWYSRSVQFRPWGLPNSSARHHSTSSYNRSSFHQCRTQASGRTICLSSEIHPEKYQAHFLEAYPSEGDLKGETVVVRVIVWSDYHRLIPLVHGIRTFCCCCHILLPNQFRCWPRFAVASHARGFSSSLPYVLECALHCCATELVQVVGLGASGRAAAMLALARGADKVIGLDRKADILRLEVGAIIALPCDADQGFLRPSPIVGGRAGTLFHTNVLCSETFHQLVT